MCSRNRSFILLKQHFESFQLLLECSQRDTINGFLTNNRARSKSLFDEPVQYRLFASCYGSS